MKEKFNDVTINVNSEDQYNIITIKKDNFNEEQYNKLKKTYKSLGFANCKFINSTHDIDIYYNTKNLKTINEYLSEIYITKVEFIVLAETIYNSIEECKKNDILKENNIMLNGDSIYINPVDEKIYLIYIPLNESITNDIFDDLETTMKKLLINKIKVRDGDRDFRQEILEKMKNKELEVLERTKIRTHKKEEDKIKPFKEDYTPIYEKSVDYEDSYKSKKGFKKILKEMFGFIKLEDIKDDILNNIDNVKNRLLDDDFDSDDTVILNDKIGYLVEHNKTYKKRIEIDKDEFIIGRFKEVVDYNIVNKTVGKIHSKIIKRGNKFYLIDLDSKNGTYINSSKLKPNIPCEIKVGSVIVFSNAKYTFEIIDSGMTYE